MNTEIENNVTPAEPVRRKGNVARLPKPLRDLVNSMLDDGKTYPEIVTALENSTEPKLPHPVTARNISNWFDGGYQDYLRNQLWAESVRGTQEKVLGAAAEDPVKFADAGVQLAATGICELLSELSRLKASDEKASDRYARIANSMARLAKTILTYEQHRHAMAKEKAAEPKQRDPKREFNDDEHLAIVDRVNRLFGLRQYRNPAIEMIGAPAVAQFVNPPRCQTKTETPAPAVSPSQPQTNAHDDAHRDDASLSTDALAQDEAETELPYDWQQLSPEYLEEWKKQHRRNKSIP